ncbi:MAG: radical SAM protein [archaeon]
MKVALIHSKIHPRKFSENLAPVDSEVGIYPPLSLLYVHKIIKDSGHDAILIDANAENLSNKDILRSIKNYKPELLAFSFHTANETQDMFLMIEFLKKATGLPVLAGGYNFNLYPEDHMIHEVLDFGLTGDVTIGLPAFLNGENLKDIPGMFYRKNEKLHKPRPLAPITYLNKMPLPSWDAVNISKYYQFISKRKNFAMILTQAGCQYRCTFCSNWEVPLDIRPLSSVMEEIEDLYLHHNVKEIDFLDATFTFDHKRIKELCNWLIKKNYDLIWDCRTRTDRVNKEILQLMGRAGCRRICYGIESSSQTILRNIRKGTNPDTVSQIIKDTGQARIEPFGFFMIGSTGETLKTIQNTINYAKSLELDYAVFSVGTAKANTDYSRELMKRTGEDYWRKFIRGETKEIVLPNPWCELPNNLLKREARRAMLNFYLRPNIIVRHLLKINSIDQIMNYSRTLVKMVIQK